MCVASIYPGPWIGPVKKLCAARKKRAMKDPECLAPGTGHTWVSKKLFIMNR